MFLFIIIFIASMGVSWMLKSRMEKYSRTALLSNVSGKEVAEMMLRDHGIFDVKVINVEGQLTDHYNPSDKTVNLSHAVYFGRNAAAVAVAAHEVGHAVQHSVAYSWLQFRSALVPLVSVTSRFISIIILVGILLLQATPFPLMLGVLLFALTTAFSFITLPVEFDASARGLKYISSKGVVTSSEYPLSKDALWWAAMTYVVAALGSLATLLYYASLLSGRRSED